MAATENGKKSEPTDEVNLSKAKPRLAHEEVSSTIQVQGRRRKKYSFCRPIFSWRTETFIFFPVYHVLILFIFADHSVCIRYRNLKMQLYEPYPNAYEIQVYYRV